SPRYSSVRLLLVGFTYLPAQEPAGSPKFFGVSLHACHALFRPRQTLDNLTLGGCFVSASGRPTPSPSALLTLTRLYQASGSAVSPTACVIPCVRFNRFV